MRTHRLPIVLLALALTAGFAAAQAPAEPPDDAAAPPATLDLDAFDPTEVKPDIPTGELALRLLPLRREALVEVCEAWIGALSDKVAALSAAQAAARRAEPGDAADAATERAAKLGLERTALATRADVAVEALREKGGDVTEYEQYLKAVSGVDVDWWDPGALWVTLRPWMTAPEGGIAWLKNISLFAVAMIIAWVVARSLTAVVGRGLGRFPGISQLLRRTITSLIRKTTLLVGFVVALSAIGVDITPMLAALGAAAIVLGLALQDTISNFFSGLMILLYRPFDVGDAVAVADVTGKVEAMSLVSTSIATFDNQQIVVPNNSIWGSVIRNVTAKDTRRVDLVFGVSYSDDLEKATRILEQVVTAHDKVLADPAPVIRVNELADSSVNFVVRPWARTADYWEVFWDITRTVKERFDAEDISIPFPQRDVHMHTVSA